MTTNSPAVQLDYDIVIAGGGMAGATLALAIVRRSPGMRIAVIEPVAVNPAPHADSRSSNSRSPAAGYQPSYDARATAMAWGTRQSYAHLGLWDALSAQATPIKRIHVSERKRFGGSRMDAAEHDQPALGYVVDNAWTGLVLQGALERQRAIDWICPARVTEVETREHYARLSLARGAGTVSITTALLVVADGGRSGLRDILGFQVERQDYNQVGLIANVSTTAAHDFEAFERFTAAGPIALLPRGDAEKAEGRCGLVWTCSPADAERMHALPDARFLKELQYAFGWRLGRFVEVGQRYTYPLELQRVRQPIRPRVVLVGNAAHTLHPVAGQGFNLAVRGLMRLAREIGRAGEKGLSPGDLPVLDRYWQAQADDVETLVRASGALVGLFSGSSAMPLELGRNAGLVALDMAPPVRRWFTRQAMGLGRGASVESVQ